MRKAQQKINTYYSDKGRCRPWYVFGATGSHCNKTKTPFYKSVDEDDYADNDHF